ncbi:putative secoisolariciresinol dehydrogenase [Helianthus anomalus]
MFCNAGIEDPYKARVMDVEKVDFQRVLDVNVLGVFLSIKHAARVMVPARAGSIISTASLASILLGQFGIRVNCLPPYVMVTPLSMSFLGLEEDEGLVNFVSSCANLKWVTLTTDDVANTALL